MALDLDRDVVEMVDAILGNVAGDYFEGWDDYWGDQTAMSERITDLLREWEKTCRRSATEESSNA